MTTYVTRTPIKHGNEDGTQVFLRPGDEVSAGDLGENGDELLIEMRLDGRVVPKEVYQGLENSVKTQADLERAQAQAQAEAARLAASPTTTAGVEATVAFEEFQKQVQRQNAKVQEEQGKGVELDENGHVKTDTSSYPIVTGSTPSPGISSLSAPEVSKRETATVKEIQEMQAKEKAREEEKQEVRKESPAQQTRQPVQNEKKQG